MSTYKDKYIKYKKKYLTLKYGGSETVENEDINSEEIIDIDDDDDDYLFNTEFDEIFYTDEEKTIGNKNEKITTPSFEKRISIKDSKITDNKCPNKSRLYELSELKSSLIVNMILKNKIINNKLRNFIFTICKHIINTNELKKCCSLKVYLSEVKKQLLSNDSIQKSKWDNYPVSQIEHFIKDKRTHDFFVSYNYMKYLWLNFQINKCSTISQNKINIYYILIEVLQQNMYKIISSAKGNSRKDIENGKKTEQVGITYIENKFLKRDTGYEKDIIKPWIHPGREQCKVPYVGTYGRFIEQNRSKNFLHGSLQCGISGSINFCIFMYIFKLSKNSLPITKSYDEDIKYIILSCIISLVGDGGHNIREVITGITLVAITLKLFSDELDNLETYPTNLNQYLYSSIEKIYYNCNNYNESHYLHVNIKAKNEIINIINDIKKIIYQIKPFINSLYIMTKHINPLAVTEQDINEVIVKEFKETKNLKNKKETLNQISKNIFYKMLFDNKLKFNNDFSLDYINATMIVTALDSDRYLKGDIINGPTNFFIKILKYFKLDDEIKKTDTEIDNIITKCKLSVPKNKVPYA